MNGHKSHRLRTFAVHLGLILAAAFMAVPLWFAFVASTYQGGDFISGHVGWLPGGNFWNTYVTTLNGTAAKALALPPMGSALLNSLIMAMLIACGKILISLPSAYAVTYFRFPFRSFCFWIIFITLMLPVEVRIVPTFQVAATLGLLNSYAGLTLPLIASATATFLFRQTFLTVPDELTEAARIDGASPLRFFVDVVIPLSRTNIAALFVILFIYGWNQYLWPLLVTTKASYSTIVMTVGRLSESSGEGDPVWNYTMATAILALLPPVFVVVAMQRLFVRGLVETEK